VATAIRIERVCRTGDVRFLTGLDIPPVTVNNRRNDGTREVEHLIERAREDPPMR
jgi:hypothetical protein